MNCNSAKYANLNFYFSVFQLWHWHGDIQYGHIYCRTVIQRKGPGFNTFLFFLIYSFILCGLHIFSFVFVWLSSGILLYLYRTKTWQFKYWLYIGSVWGCSCNTDTLCPFLECIQPSPCTLILMINQDVSVFSLQ